MTVPADFDTTSTIALGLCHLALVPITILSLKALRSTATATPAAPATTDRTLPAQPQPDAGRG